MAEKTSKTKKRITNPAKRHRQNMRTYLRVQRARVKHAKNHRFNSVMEMEEAMGIKRWTKIPTSKAQSGLMK
jgi:hypothetical protein